MRFAYTEVSKAERHYPSFDRPGVVVYEIDLGGEGQRRERAYGYGKTIADARMAACLALDKNPQEPKP